MDEVPSDELIPPDLEESPWPWDVDPMLVAISVVRRAYRAGEQEIAAQLATWLGEDQETWLVVRLTMIMPWQGRPGEWHQDTPSWLLLLGEQAAAVLAKNDSSL